MLMVTYRETMGEDGDTELNTYCAKITRVHVEADKYDIQLSEMGVWQPKTNNNFEPYHAEWENGWQVCK